LDPGEAEVGELHASFTVDENVSRGDVPMQNAVNLAFTIRVRIAERRSNPLSDPHHLPRRESGVAPEHSEINAINELEDNVRSLGLELVIEDIDEVPVMKMPSDARFTREELSASSFARTMCMKHFQASPAFGTVVTFPYDFVGIGCSTASDLADDAILVDRLRDRARPASHAALPLAVFLRSMSTEYLRAAA
jgi:hypothetical protein